MLIHINWSSMSWIRRKVVSSDYSYNYLITVVTNHINSPLICNKASWPTKVQSLFYWAFGQYCDIYKLFQIINFTILIFQFECTLKKKTNQVQIIIRKKNWRIFIERKVNSGYINFYLSDVKKKTNIVWKQFFVECKTGYGKK